jgi:hypothetical protein
LQGNSKDDGSSVSAIGTCMFFLFPSPPLTRACSDGVL